MNFSKRLQLVFIISILVISFVLRLYALGRVPNGLTVDEADMGYNAYSVLKTGKDVYGRKLPIFFQSLDDYKPGFAIYSSIPAIKIFGLSDFSVRFMAAILGVITPLLIFAFLKILYPQNKFLPYIGFILMVFAPWNIEISRATLMYIELIFFILLSLIFFLLGLKNKLFLIVSAAFLSFTLYIYYAAVFYVPVIILILFLIYFKELLRFKKFLFIVVITLIVIALPAVSHYMGAGTKSRFNAISIFTPDIALSAPLKEASYDKNTGLNLFLPLHNRRIIYLSDFLGNYFNYYNLSYLFVNSSGTRYFYVNYVGLFYLVEVPFFLYGLLQLFKSKNKANLLILALLFIGPVPAAITLGAAFPHRGIVLILAMQLVIAIGISTLFENKKVSKVIWPFIVLIYFFNVIFFLHQYFVHSPQEFTSESDNGAWFSTVKNIIPKIDQYRNQYDNVVFTWPKLGFVPPIYYLFYDRIDPQIIQKRASLWKNEPPSFRQIYNKIGNVEFRPIDWEVDKNLQNTLFIGYQKDFPKEVENVIDQTNLPGDTRFLFVKSQ